MVRGLCAMLVVCVSFSSLRSPYLILMYCTDYAKIVRKSGASKLAHGGTNLKPKPAAPGPGPDAH